jgi:hypothetical protein
MECLEFFTAGEEREPYTNHSNTRAESTEWKVRGRIYSKIVESQIGAQIPMMQIGSRL